MFNNPNKKKKFTKREIHYVMEDKWKKEHTHENSRKQQKAREEEIKYVKPKKPELSEAERKLHEETEKNKKSVIVQLRKTPLVQFSCERSGIARSTYYKWRANDKVFARAADRAIEAGRFFINDLAESKLMNKIQKDDSPAIMFWLRHNHPNYALRHQNINPYEVVSKRPTIEEETIWMNYLAGMQAWAKGPTVTTNDIREYIEHQLNEAEINKEDQERFDSFNED